MSAILCVRNIFCMCPWKKRFGLQAKGAKKHKTIKLEVKKDFGSVLFMLTRRCFALHITFKVILCWTYNFLPFHPSVLVPRFDLELTETQRLREVYSVTDETFQSKKMTIFTKSPGITRANHQSTKVLPPPCSIVATHLSGVDRYFCFSKRFSSPINCNSVNTVRLRRPFLLLPVPSHPWSNFPRRWGSRGRWWGGTPTWRLAAADSSGEPNGELSVQGSGDKGNFTRLVWSAFNALRREWLHINMGYELYFLFSFDLL